MDKDKNEEIKKIENEEEEENKQNLQFEIVNFNDYWNEDVILQDLFLKSFEVREDNPKLSENDGNSNGNCVKQKMVDFKNNLKYNIININSINIDNLSKEGVFYLYSKKYKLSNPEQVEKLKERIASILFFSYRKNFPSIIDYNTNQEYTSDCGWGCMIRSGQMILSRALYKLFRYEKNETNKALLYSLSLFIEYPLQLNSLPAIYMSMIYKFIQKNFLKNANIVSVLPPFSIKNIVKTGAFLHKRPGDWFSDIHIASIFSLINNYFSVVPHLRIKGMQSCLYMKELIETCFTKEHKGEEIEYENEKYYFTYAGFFLVSIRLGLNEISSEYFNSIKDLFSCNQCVGIIGGKNSSAYYFIGHDNEHIFYLDPHLSQNSIKELSDWESYIKKKIHKTKFGCIQTAFSIGFLVSSITDYKELIDWATKHQTMRYPCITLAKKDINENIVFNNNDSDDF